MSRAVIHESFGGPEVLELREVAGMFGHTALGGFGYDLAGVVDEMPVAYGAGLADRYARRHPGRARPDY
jgi:hypothetical protein